MSNFERINSSLEKRAEKNIKGIDEEWISENEANELYSSNYKSSNDDKHTKEEMIRELKEIKEIIASLPDNEGKVEENEDAREVREIKEIIASLSEEEEDISSKRRR